MNFFQAHIPLPTGVYYLLLKNRNIVIGKVTEIEFIKDPKDKYAISLDSDIEIISEEKKGKKLNLQDFSHYMEIDIVSNDYTKVPIPSYDELILETTSEWELRCSVRY